MNAIERMNAADARHEQTRRAVSAVIVAVAALAVVTLAARGPDMAAKAMAEIECGEHR